MGPTALVDDEARRAGLRSRGRKRETVGVQVRHEFWLILLTSRPVWCSMLHRSSRSLETF